MRILILADESFAARERTMLSRLEVGLADEGARVIHAIPARAAAAHHPEVFSQTVTYEEGSALSRRWRAQRLARAAQELAESGDAAGGSKVDLVHVFGEHAWSIGADAAALLGAGLILEVWSGSLALRPRGAGAAHDSGALLCLTPDPAIARILQEQDRAAPVRVAPWGVHTPAAPHDILKEGRSPFAVLIASGRDPAGMGAALEGLARAMTEVPDLMVFADSAAVERARLWPQVKKLGITDRFTLAADLEARRELALRADLLILPEALGDHRTVALDAMAAGMIVVAAADPLVGTLIDGRTARLVTAPRPGPWADALRWVFTDRAAARSLGLSAREHIRECCRASSQVSAVVDAYEWMLQGESIPFKDRAG
ncbi:MAG: glycosyltransferase [Phycisphaerales bacterium]